MIIFGVDSLAVNKRDASGSFSMIHIKQSVSIAGTRRTMATLHLANGCS